MRLPPIGTRSVVLLGIVATPASIFANDSDTPTVRLGESIYRNGVGVDGEPVKATVQGDIQVDGTQFTCAGCHQRSGFGSSEGGLLVPPIAGNFLFSPDETRRPELSEPIVRRPAYTEKTLKRALVDGVNANGEPLSAVMPRYTLDSTELEALTSYLRKLSTAPAIGIDDETIHIATIVDDRTDPQKVDAMLTIMQQYFKGKNAGTRQEATRAANAPWHKDWHFSAYRNWQLHTWTLEGSEATWADQVRSFYEEQPVFAIVGGTTVGDWTPVHDFCEAVQVPCLLPTLRNAPDRDDSYYSVYFTRGLKDESSALALWLANNDPVGTVVQLHDSSDWSTHVAAAFAMTDQGSRRIVNIDTDDPESMDKFKSLLDGPAAVTVIAWLDEDNRWWKRLRRQDGIGKLLVSSTLVDDYSKVMPADDAYPVFTIHQYQIGRELSQSRRLRAWARTRNIELTELRLQANTYYVMAVLGDALQHIRGNFSREYLLEKIEHMSSRILVASAYKKVSIAPGQRYMAKGSYVIPLNSDGTRRDSDAEWIVP